MLGHILSALATMIGMLLSVTPQLRAEASDEGNLPL